MRAAFLSSTLKSNILAYFMVCICSSPLVANAAWNKDWDSSAKISVNTQGITETLTQVPVAIRLHSGNFDFINAKIDGSDLRFIAADEKTELNYYIEKFDSVNELAIVWIQLPKIDPAEKEAHIWMYTGNENATAASNAKATWDANTVAAYHFAEAGLLRDSANSSVVANGEVLAQKAGLLGESVTFAAKPILLSSNPATNISAITGYTWSAWIKPASLPQTANLYMQGSVSLAIASEKLTLNIGEASVVGGELKGGAWQHVAFTLEGGKANIYINGVAVASGDVPVTEVADEISIGEGFIGDMDEMEIASVARRPGMLALVAANQGAESKLLTLSAADDEGNDEGGEANYIGILINSLTVDAKIVIGILAVMFVISIWVMLQKAMLVSKTDKDNKKFLARFQKTNSDDLLTLDMGASYPNSTLFKLYLAGLREIKKRQHPEQKLSLSGASMDAIKAAIDADLVRETQKQNAGMVLLTIAISGGPFLGLLGTVVGVMITFAAIAAAGDVNVNAIAPGIAAALLATVAGLAVAIPALFGYNYLASRIKTITIAMQIFVDEFVTRSAELFGKE